MSSSQLAIVQTYTVQTNGNSTASKAKKPSHGNHLISVYCNNTSTNYCNIFSYLCITYNTSGACLNLRTWVLKFLICVIVLQENATICRLDALVKSLRHEFWSYMKLPIRCLACDLCDGPSKLPTSSSVKAAAVNTCKDTVPVYLNITTWKWTALHRLCLICT